MYARTHALAHTRSCRRNAKRGQDQLDSIDFIGKNSTATFVRVNFNQKTMNFGWGRGWCALMGDRRATLGLSRPETTYTGA